MSRRKREKYKSSWNVRKKNTKIPMLKGCKREEKKEKRKDKGGKGSEDRDRSFRDKRK